jgi:hypothetical protein
MTGQASQLDDKTFERKERVMHTYYERLNDLDKSVRYFVFTIPAPWSFNPPQLYFPLGVLLIAVITWMPWAYFAGILRPTVLWAVLCAPWAREV